MKRIMQKYPGQMRTKFKGMVSIYLIESCMPYIFRDGCGIGVGDILLLTKVP